MLSVVMITRQFTKNYDILLESNHYLNYESAISQDQGDELRYRSQLFRQIGHQIHHSAAFKFLSDSTCPLSKLSIRLFSMCRYNNKKSYIMHILEILSFLFFLIILVL